MFLIMWPRSQAARPSDIDGYDLRVYDTAKPAIFGPHQEFFASSRLDNLSSMHASIVAMINADDGDAIQMIAAFDHEELGSASRSGASGPLLADILTRISDGLGATLDQRHRSLARDVLLVGGHRSRHSSELSQPA